MSEVQAAKWAAVRRDFPFIDRYAPNVAWLGEVPQVKRVDLDLLERHGYSKAWNIEKNKGLLQYCHGESRFVFIGHDGTEVGAAIADDVKYVTAIPRFGNLYMPKQQVVWMQGESVLEAIRRIDRPDDISCVLRVSDVFSALRGNAEVAYGHDEWEHGGLVLTIFKIPKDRAFSAWVTELFAAAQKELRAHVAELDHV